MKRLPKQSTILPPDAREALIAASKVRGQQDRQRAIQAAIERIQRKYPNHFNQGATA